MPESSAQLLSFSASKFAFNAQITMRSSLIVLIFAAVFVLARPIEDDVDSQDVFDAVKKSKAKAAPKSTSKSKSTPKSSKSSKSSSGLKSAAVDILGQAANGAAEGVATTLTTAAVDALKGDGAPADGEAPAANAATDVA